MEDILQNQQLSDESERLEIENYEFSKALNSGPFPKSKLDTPKEKKESGFWRRQLVGYLHKDDLNYNVLNGKLDRTGTEQSFDNPKPAASKIEVYFHVRVRIDTDFMQSLRHLRSAHGVGTLGKSMMNMMYNTW
jgi:hypothetical protein